MIGVCNSPFPHVVIDGFIPRELARAASMEWPNVHWPHWHSYGGIQLGKYASKDPSRLTPACMEIMRQMLSIPLEQILKIQGTFPDFSLHGAGMHMMIPGSSVPLHLDSDHHPLLGWRRRASCILWLDDWQESWGGSLRLWETKDKPAVSICPQAGRLAVFECSDSSYHDVSQISNAAPIPRRSLAAFYWSVESSELKKRPTAEFLV